MCFPTFPSQLEDWTWMATFMLVNQAGRFKKIGISVAVNGVTYNNEVHKAIKSYMYMMYCQCI